MKEFLFDHYMTIKALHVISVIAWMSGIFYLPRLFVYHTETRPGEADYERFCRMERRLLKIIMAPAAVLTWTFGLTMAWLNNFWMAHWFELKFLLVLGMTWVHVSYIIWARDFARFRNKRPAIFFRIWNEAPTILMIVIVILVITKPI